MSVEFTCRGCGQRAERAGAGAIFCYQGLVLMYELCKSCAATRGKKFERICERAELALLPAEGAI